MKKLGIYIHVPFCFRKCNYCDFLSFGESTPHQHDFYFQSMMAEIAHYGRVYGNEFYVDTIFIGGGTPSLVDEVLIGNVISAIKRHFHVAESCEITMESNPKTLTAKKLTSYLETGINRLSMGVQSMNDTLLTYMGRIHNHDDAIENYLLARECGFQNINLDLIFSVPGMSLEIWQNTLEEVISLKPEHISFYSLQLEEGTPFFKEFKAGTFHEIDDALDRQMYWTAVERLRKADYLHYEISNASKYGHECRHNLKYWSLENYLGVGLGSHSYINGARFSNLTNLEAYCNADENWTEWSHKNTLEDDIAEYLITAMRKIEGISLPDFHHRFGKTLESLYGKQIDEFVRDGFLTIENGVMKFTGEGINVSNKILSEFV